MYTVGKTVLTVVASIILAVTSPGSAEGFGAGGDTSTMRSSSQPLRRAQHAARRGACCGIKRKSSGPSSSVRPPALGRNLPAKTTARKHYSRLLHRQHRLQTETTGATRLRVRRVCLWLGRQGRLSRQS
jgi:hypothetical protein